METTGSNCFYQSLSVNSGPFGAPLRLPAEGVELLRDVKHDVNFVKLPKLTSRASSLGASWPSPGAVKLALDRQGGVKSVCVPDEMAMQTSFSFAGTPKKHGHRVVRLTTQCRRAENSGRVGLRHDPHLRVFTYIIRQAGSPQSRRHKTHRSVHCMRRLQSVACRDGGISGNCGGG